MKVEIEELEKDLENLVAKIKKEVVSEDLRLSKILEEQDINIRIALTYMRTKGLKRQKAKKLLEELFDTIVALQNIYWHAKVAYEKWSARLENLGIELEEGH